MKFFKHHKIITGLLFFFLILFFLYLYGGSGSKKIEYGVTFSQDQAQSLGLNWKEVYTAMLTDLKVKRLRLSAYWNKTEPKNDEYNFSDLDFMLGEAKNHNVEVVLSVGRRLPRWPECHDPEWIKNLSPEALKTDLLSFVETVVTRYQANSAITVWQVENEPFLGSFGICPKPDSKLIDSEIALVKKLDPGRPVLVSDSGELSFWLSAGKRGDIFGTTMYRYVYNDKFNMYWVSYVPYWTYRIRAGFLKLLYGNKQVVIIELQSEPWTTKGILSTSLEEQFKTMSFKKFNNLLSIAKATSFSPQYLWGVEWWYYMKEKQGHGEYWEAAKQLFK